MPGAQLMQDVSIFKPVILAGINAITPVFGPAYVDEFNQPAIGSSAVQIRGAFSTERRRAPNVVVTYTPGTGVFNSGQNIIGFDAASGLYKYGFYMNNGSIKYAVQARNEPEREWLIDTIFNAFTALVFVDPMSGVTANNNLVDYLASQGVVIKGPGQIEYPHVIQSDTESPRPEGQVWEGALSMVVDVSLTYYMPGVSASTVTMTGTSIVSQHIPIVLPWIPQPRDNPPISLSYP